MGMEGVKMSDKPAPALPDYQFKVKISPPVEIALEGQKEALGFHSGNALAAVYVTALSGVPANKVWEVLANIRTYHPKPPANPKTGYKGGKAK